MFEAFVLVCYMGNPEYCKGVSDTRGPYETSEICHERLEEMKDDLIDIFPKTKLLPHSGYCGKINETKERIAL